MKPTLALAVSLALAGFSPASAQIVVDHQPNPLGGGVADTAFLFGGQPFWRLSADDFVVGVTTDIKSVVWWGYYRTPTPADETMRIRLYDARPGDGLPGPVLFEQLVFDSHRTATGRHVADQGQPPEYRYETALSNPMALQAGTPYWLEITQIGDLASTFVHEQSLADQTPYAFRDQLATDWRRSGGTADLAFQLIVPEPATAALMLFGALRLRRRIKP